MKKLFFLFLIGFAISGNSQVKVNFGSNSGNVGDTVSVNITIDNFTQLTGFQYNVSYDSLVVQYVGWTDRNSKINNISVQDYGNGTNSIYKNGQLGVQWFIDFQGTLTIPNNETILSLRFKLIGKQCDSSFIKFETKPSKVEFLDANGDETSFNPTGGIGKVKINGPGCISGGGGGGGSTDVTLIASEETGPKNAVTKIKVSVKNFKNIASAQGTIKWDPTVAKYEYATAVGIRGIMFQPLSDSSGMRYLWDIDSTAGKTLADNSVIFEIGLRGVGAVGSMTPVTFANSPTGQEITDYDRNILNGIYQNGKYTITAGTVETLKLYYRDTFANENSELCIPILVDGFDCMESFQFAIKYDSTLLRFSRIDNTAIVPFGAGRVNIAKDSIRIVWDKDNQPFQSRPNGSHIFNICFNVVGKCTVDTKLSIVGLPGGLIEFTNCRGELAFTKAEPNIQIRCGVAPVVCRIDSTIGITCNGVCDGRAGVTLSGGSGGPFTYEWLRISPPPSGVVSTVQDPIGLCAGDYRLRYRDVNNGNLQGQCPLITIDDVTPIICSAKITHVSTQGGSDGKIDVTVTGGTPNYTYMWTRLNSTVVLPTTEDLSNRTPGTYILKVTDSKGCMKLDTFKIDPFTPPTSVAIVEVDSIKCFGECNGTLNANGTGPIPYTFKWNGPSGMITTNPARNLCAGSYTVTITDGNGNTATSSYILTQPSAINIQQVSMTTSEVTVTGGSPPYQISWKNAQGQVVGTGSAPNLPVGTYNVMVADRNNCMQNIEIIVKPTGTVDTLKVRLAIDPKQNGGAISCKGSCDGKIIATATGGKSPYNYKWSHNANLNSTIASDLCPGTYRVTITDNAGTTAVSSNLVISDIAGISISVKRITCTSDNTTSDGSYEAIATGGTKPYTYRWCSGEITATATGLPSGACNVVVTDQNGCTSSESFTVCITGSPDINCYTGRLTISPNRDGYNDFLEISCVKDVENVLYIYNRWGKQVFTAINYLNTWDAVDQEGKELNEGTYMWVLLVREPGKNDQYKKGTVTVVR